jgi:hypothetical protein
MLEINKSLDHPSMPWIAAKHDPKLMSSYAFLAKLNTVNLRTMQKALWTPMSTSSANAWHEVLKGNCSGLKLKTSGKSMSVMTYGIWMMSILPKHCLANKWIQLTLTQIR